MVVDEFLKVLASGGAGAALVAYLFWQNMKAEAAEKFERERYIATLEKQNEELRMRLSQTESPTRPIRWKANR